MFHPTIAEFLGVCTIGSAIGNVVAFIKWATHTLDEERKTILRNHVWNHRKRLKKCEQDDCPKL